jgi:hypothetical protein
MRGASILILLAMGCGHGSRPPADATHAPKPVQHFHAVLTSQDLGVVPGPRQTITVDSDGTLAVQIDGSADARGQIDAASVQHLAALIGDPALAEAPSAELPGEGTLITLSITGDATLDKRFGHGVPDGAKALVSAIRTLVPAPPKVPDFTVSASRQMRGTMDRAPVDTVSAQSNGELHVTHDKRAVLDATMPPDAIASIARLLADPGLVKATSDAPRDVGVETRLQAAGIVTLDARFYGGAPRAADVLVQALWSEARTLGTGAPCGDGTHECVGGLTCVDAPDAAHGTCEGDPPAFTLTVTTQMFGVAVGPKESITIDPTSMFALSKDGKLQFKASIGRDKTAALEELLTDPALASATSSDMRSEGTQVTIHATGAATIDLHYQAGSGPAPAEALVKALLADVAPSR